MIKKIAIILVLLLIVINISACRGDDNEEPYEEIPVSVGVDDAALRNTILYFEDDNGYLVPTMRQIQWEEGIGRASVENLKSDDQKNISLSEKGLLPILSMDTQVKLSISDGLAICDLSQGAILADDLLSEKNKVDAVINTLCEFDSIDAVQITIDGENIESLPNGTLIGMPVVPEEINVETAADASIVGENKIRLYFENQTTSVLVPVTRGIFAEPNEFSVMTELMRGPTKNSGLSNIFPEGTRLLDIKVTDQNVLEVNLSKEAKGLKDSPEKEKMLMMILLKTFEQFDNVDNVRILIDGKEYLDSAKETMALMLYINIIE